MYKRIDFKPKVHISQTEELELTQAEELNTIE